jgi:asparagine synthase (glutamine-hydrolysing)
MVPSVDLRCPEPQGQWHAPDPSLGFVQPRIAVVDLSARAYQSMCSASSPHAIASNGAVYNEKALRHVRDAPRFRSHSDTATLLATIEHWDAEAIYGRVVLKFAFGLWGRRSKSRKLYRDRMGEKPLC